MSSMIAALYGESVSVYRLGSVYRSELVDYIITRYQFA